MSLSSLQGIADFGAVVAQPASRTQRTMSRMGSSKKHLTIDRHGFTVSLVRRLARARPERILGEDVQMGDEAMSETARWIGTENDQFEIGQTGFLVKIHNTMKGWTRFDLRDHPAKTNQSYEPRLHGWCGTTNDVSVFGLGVARVERVAKNGRAFVRELEGDDLNAALEELGYPDL